MRKGFIYIIIKGCNKYKKGDMMDRRLSKGVSCWQGLPPAQYIYTNLRFLGVALEPPNFEPGSWCGAGKAVIDYENEAYLLTSRPRKLEGGVRGYAANVYRSKDGVSFDRISSLTQDEVSAKSGIKVWSIEGTQLLKDPLTGRWHLYLSVDTGSAFVMFGVFWETMVFVADDLKGPWTYMGRAIRRGQGRVFDAVQARYPTIDIVDGQWLCLYRAHDLDWKMSMGLATSTDGISWEKRGQFTVDGDTGHTHLGMMGGIFAASFGPIFMGLTDRNEQNRRILSDFTAFRIDDVNMNLRTIFRAPWIARSEYEHKENPVHGHNCSLVYDPFKNRMLFYPECIGPESKKFGGNNVIERVLVYECPL